MPPATLTAHGLSKSYGGHLVLDRVSLVVAPGDRIGIVAPNGTGKSTLLRLLAREDQPDSGSVVLAPPEATVGHLTQEVERGRETVRQLLARRTGVAGANASLDLAARGVADGVAGAEEVYTAALDRYLARGAADFDTRLARLLDELGLDAQLVDRRTATLSGGQAARVALAAILLARYDVFLLDEPTNDLDFAGLDRLSEYLTRLPGGAVVVSHDRAFLEHTITSVLEIDEHTHRARRYEGGWLAYQDERARDRLHAEQRYAEYTAHRAVLTQRAQREREWSHQGLSKARGQDEPDRYIRSYKKAQSEQLAGRARRTERMSDRLDVVDKPWEGWELHLELAAAPRSGELVAALDSAVVDRGDFRLGPVDLEIRWRDRIAIGGANGSGKTTLLETLMGGSELGSGARRLGPGVIFGELDQARARFAGVGSLSDAFSDASGCTVTETRTLLAKFGLGADHVTRDADSLSPGERTRAALALLMAIGANCLVLDEPTNHLDLPAITQLEQALATWDHTLLVVTHDQRFLDAMRLDRRLRVEAGVVTEPPT